MKNNVADWVGMKLDKISGEDLFRELFSNTPLNRIEDSFYLTNLKKGIGLVLSQEKVITTVHLSSGQEGEYGLFSKELPFALSFSLTKENMRKVLGNPNKTGGGHNDLYIGYVEPWEKFYLDPYTLHVVYTKTGTIAKIAVGLLELESYFDIALQ